MVRLHGGFARNRPKQKAPERRGIDPKMLMAGHRVLENVAKMAIAKRASMSPGASINGMPLTLFDVFLSASATVGLRGPRGWCASGEAKSGIDATWRERETARKDLRAPPYKTPSRRKARRPLARTYYGP